jgi:hypothetical protein
MITLLFNAPTLLAASRSNDEAESQMRKLVSIRHLTQRILRDSRVLKHDFDGVSREIRIAMIYLNGQAKVNMSKNEEKHESLIDAKRYLCEKALRTVTEVSETLSDEDQYNPVMVLGFKMEPPIISALVGVLVLAAFAALNKKLGLENPF